MEKALTVSLLEDIPSLTSCDSVKDLMSCVPKVRDQPQCSGRNATALGTSLRHCLV